MIILKKKKEKENRKIISIILLNFSLVDTVACGNKNKFIQDQAFIDNESRNDKITKVHQIAAKSDMIFITAHS